jgi:ribosome-binding protein aMBF1 (putative translation factor)
MIHQVEQGLIMKKEKTQRLKESGWIETTPQEFLELTPEETAYIELKLQLSHSLRERREMLNLSQQALAEKLESSQSRVSKMEAGDPTVSLDLLIRSLLSMGTTPAELGRIFAANS